MLSLLYVFITGIALPVGFVSLGIPNLSRIICKNKDIKTHYILSSIMGSLLLLATYLVVNYVNFGIYLPVSATMAIIALPLMVFLFVKK